MTEFSCGWCDITHPHHHGETTALNGERREVIFYHSDRNPKAELRDSETGEVIFRAVKGPLRLIEGDTGNTADPDRIRSEGPRAAQVERESPREEDPLPSSRVGEEP